MQVSIDDLHVAEGSIPELGVLLVYPVIEESYQTRFTSDTSLKKQRHLDNALDILMIGRK